MRWLSCFLPFAGPPPDDDMLAPPPEDLMFGLDEGTPAAPPSEPAVGPSPAHSDGLQALADLGNMSTPGDSIRYLESPSCWLCQSQLCQQDISNYPEHNT